MQGEDYSGLIFEARAGAWFYAMPSGAHMKVFGPFSCDEFATEHLRRSHPNPGTFQEVHLAPGQEELDLSGHPLLKEWLRDAGFFSKE